MKLYLVTIITALAMTVSSVNAQSINVGTKIGLNSYTIHNDNGPGFDSNLGLHAGIFGHIHLTRQIGLQPELVYSMQGASRGNTNYNLDYINIPVMFQYFFDNGFRLQAGPQLGLLVRGKAVNNNATVDIKDNYNITELGLSVGASYVHLPSSFGIDARYNYGLSDISKNSLVDSRNRGFQIGIFYLFDHRD